MSKAELEKEVEQYQELIGELREGFGECLNPALSREEVIVKLQELEALLPEIEESDEEDEEEEEEG
jgi:hypothetical protein